ncbi:hypothetical protein Cgig2_002447 [Carnegiea gigantea]|uniref:RanBD1 domain-containing protein n=1 Tax=Carnegiea gigantea TaxID=171969 RepID=A0A9Q1KT19_9CARY|nr:hypothetical protein Cgig2_002447 [Carnegiea gigantea]
MGTKRRSLSLRSDADDIAFQSKRLIGESPLGGQAPTQSEVAASPSLDRRRAARQHVRALNTEFARWVQSQLKEHPDELWEDGVREYLAHASDILVKFTDVIKWLNAGSGREGNVPNVGTRSTESNNPPETNSKEPKSFTTFMFSTPSANASKTTTVNAGSSSAQTSAAQATTASSALSWSFGLSASSQALSQSSSAGLASSWSSGVFSSGKSPSPIETVSFSASPSSGELPSSQTSSVTTPVSFAASSSSGLLSSSQPASFGTTPSFAAPWSAGAFSSSQTAFKFGNQSSAPSNDTAKVDADNGVVKEQLMSGITYLQFRLVKPPICCENEPEQPSSPSLKRSEEKGIVVVHETKCKLYVKSTDPDDKEPWKDKGTGQLFIKCEEGASKGSKESKPRILVRNDVGRIMLNASIYPGIKTNLQKNAIVTIFHVSDDSGDNAKAVARTFLLRTKNEEERNKLADSIRDHAPAA